MVSYFCFTSICHIIESLAKNQHQRSCCHVYNEVREVCFFGIGDCPTWRTVTAAEPIRFH